MDIASVPSPDPALSPSAHRILVAHATAGNNVTRAGAVQSAPRRPLHVSSWLFLFLLTLESALLISTALAGVITNYRDSNSAGDDGRPSEGKRDADTTVLITACVAVTATGGVLYFAIDAIRLQHRFQLLAAVGAHLSIVAFAIVHYRSSDLGQWYRMVSQGIMLLVLFCQCVYVALAKFVIQSFGRRMFDRLRSSRPELIAAYQTSEIFFCLLKYDVFLQVLLLMLAAFFLTKPTLMPVSIAALGITFACLALGHTGVRLESIVRMRIFFGLTALQPIYIFWIAHEVYSDSGQFAQYTFEQFLVTSIMALMCRAALLTWSWWCLKNFGKGLKERLWDEVAMRGVHARPAVVRVIHRASEMTQSSVSRVDGADDPTEFAGSHHDAPASLQSVSFSLPLETITGSVGVHAAGGGGFLDHDDSIVRSAGAASRATAAAAVPFTPADAHHARMASSLRGLQSRASDSEFGLSGLGSDRSAQAAQLKQQLLAHEPDDNERDEVGSYASPEFREEAKNEPREEESEV